MAEVLTLGGLELIMLFDYFYLRACGNTLYVHAGVNDSAEATSVYMSL